MEQDVDWTNLGKSLSDLRQWRPATEDGPSSKLSGGEDDLCKVGSGPLDPISTCKGKDPTNLSLSQPVRKPVHCVSSPGPLVVSVQDTVQHCIL